MPFPRDAGRGVRDDELELGFISGTFGVRGEVRLHLHNRDSDFLSRRRAVVLVGPDGERFCANVSSRSGAGRRILGRIGNVDSKTLADALKGLRVVVARRHLPPPAEDEFYLYEMEGLEVFVADARVGTVRSVHSSKDMDVLELDMGAVDSVFVPCLREFVLAVDVRGQRVDISPEALEVDE